MEKSRENAVTANLRSPALGYPVVVLPRVLIPPDDGEVRLAVRGGIQRLNDASYHNGAWTCEDLEALAWKRLKHEDWESMIIFRRSYEAEARFVCARLQRQRITNSPSEAQQCRSARC